VSTPETPSLPEEESLQLVVDLFAALAHPARALVLLALGRHGPISVSALTRLAGIEQSAMSHQLRVLRDARLVRTERRGKRVFYHLHDDHVAHIVEDALSHVVESTDD